MTADKGRALLLGTIDGPIDSTGYEFLLVLTPDAYERAATSGAQPILPSIRFSETDERGALRRFLGPLNMAWRWRRYLLNEGISDLRISAIDASVLPLIGGAWLAGTGIRIGRTRR